MRRPLSLVQAPAGDGNQISRTDGAGRTWSRGVDAAGRTTSVTDPNGFTTTMGLDGPGRIVSWAWPRLDSSKQSRRVRSHTFTDGYEYPGEQEAYRESYEKQPSLPRVCRWSR